jgi:hypothetical protein
MRTRAILAVAASALLGWLGTQVTAQEKTSVPSFTSAQLAERTLQRRAIEAMNWGMPAVNYDLMLQAFIKAGGATNQIVYWSGLPSWKNQTLTPNPDLIYLMPFFNTKEAGPMVLEIPPADDGSITGTIMDVWQSALEDVGPAGADKGRGGKYLILPPGYEGKVAEGYFVLRSHNYQGYALLRSVLSGGSAADVAKAVAYGKRIKLYPLSQAATPPATAFIDVLDTLFDANIQYDVRFFESLNRMVQIEPWLPRDMAMIDQLRSVGIEKGRPFNPDAKTQDVLTAAAREAEAWLAERYETGFPPFYEGSHWSLPGPPEFLATMGSDWEKPDVYAVDARGLAYTYVFSSVKRLGGGQFYLLTFRDKDGQALDGGSNYRVRMPAHPPVRQFWSLVVYDHETHGLIRNVSRASRSSQSQGLHDNADGSVDVYFGPGAPSGQESNWIPTVAGRKWEILFRAYDPEKPLFDKTWKLPDIEKVN